MWNQRKESLKMSFAPSQAALSVGLKRGGGDAREHLNGVLWDCRTGMGNQPKTAGLVPAFTTRALFP